MMKVKSEQYGKKVGTVRGRALIPNWACYLVLEVQAGITPEIVAEIGNRAGRNIGVGDFRPERGGPFGRYMVKLMRNQK